MLLLPEKTESLQEDVDVIEPIYMDRYEVLQTFTYLDKQLGQIIIEKGEMFHRFIDEPNNFSNGISIISEITLQKHTNVFKGLWNN